MKTYTVTVDDYGTREWYVNGELHREDGPAVEEFNGTKCWYINGNRHRIDGPAIEYYDGSECWYINNKKMSESEWKLAIAPKQSCAGKIMEIDGVKYKLIEA
jgi:hypothetical protein